MENPNQLPAGDRSAIPALFPDAEELLRFRRSFAGRIGERIEYLRETPSTQDAVLDAAEAGAPDGFLCVAESQTRGRGRRGRPWEAPPGSSLLFSVLIRRVPAGLVGWTGLCGAAAVARAVRELSGAPARIKWPNDVVVPVEPPSAGPAMAWRKLAGTLPDARWTGGELLYVVLGIGINVLQAEADLPRDARSPATSVRIASGKDVDRRDIFAAVLSALGESLDALRRGGAAWSPWRARIADEIASWWRGRRVEVLAAGRRREGEYRGLDDAGALRLALPGGEESFADAEVRTIS